MIAEQLKKSILQAAIQGKLTQQLPEDGDARDLLKEIRKEKARLIKEGKIKKEKPLPEITEDEIPFEIPENWCWVRLGEITDYGIGKQVNAEKIKPNSWILELEDIEKETFKLTCKRFDRKPGSSKNAFSEGCVLYGKLRPYLKKVIIADESGYCSTEIIPFCGYGNINSSYLKYCMVAPSIDSIINQITHGMDMPRLGTDKAKLILVPLPPLSEQKRIVACLEELLPEIESLKNDETKLEELQKSFPKKMKDAILQYAIQGKLTQQLPEDGDASDLLKEIKKEKARLIKEGKIKKEKPLPEITEDEIPFEIPENWCWVRLGEITDYGVGKQVSAEKIKPNSWILELEDIEKETFKLTCKRFDREPGSSKNAFSEGCVLYGKLRPYLKKVIIADESGYCSTEIIPFRGYGNINSSYLKYCMVAPSIDSIINQITHGMDMPRLGTDKAKLLIIPLPPLAEQKRIVACLEELLPLCEGLQ